MIRDLEKDRPTAGEHCGVCIVGAGAAGIALAVELARRGRKVTVLEAGGAAFEERSQELYNSEIGAKEHRGIHTGRFRVHGGTTTRWGGQILELDEVDFERRAWILRSGWPFPKQELTRYYAAALELEGLAGAVGKDADLWTKLKIIQPQYESLEAYVSRWCPEPNFAILHASVLQSEKIEVWLHANAIEIELVGEAVQAIRCKTLDGVEARFIADEFIFCLGGIESSRFFLQPRDGRLPWNESGLLGKHFQDHIDTNAATVRVQNPRRFHQLFDNVFLDGYKYHPKLRLNKDRQREFDCLNAGATMYFEGAIGDSITRVKQTAKKILRGNWKSVCGEDLPATISNLPFLLKQSWRYKVDHRMYNPDGAVIRLRVHCEQEPASASSIQLTETRDSLGMFRAKLDWKIAELELKTILRMAEAVQRELKDIAVIEIDKSLVAMDDSYKEFCDDSNHHMGGMRMGDSPSQGVVDSNLRLHGTSNCYVCSAAVFPSSGFSNPTHTLLALAMRLAERLGQS